MPSHNSRTNTADGEYCAGILEKALGVFDARLATVPFEHGIKLQHWKETAVGVYLGFVAKLPDAELPILVVHATWEDSRAEESWCPSLMVPG